MSDTIFLKGLALHAYHGVMQHEAKVGQTFYVDLQLDLELVAANYVDNDPKKGIQVTVTNLEQMAMPFTIEVKLKDGTSQRMKIPIEAWLQNNMITFTIPTTSAAEKVTIDPDSALPDINRGNNGIIMK